MKLLLLMIATLVLLGCGEEIDGEAYVNQWTFRTDLAEFTPIFREAVEWWNNRDQAGQPRLQLSRNGGSRAYFAPIKGGAIANSWRIVEWVWLVRFSEEENWSDRMFCIAARHELGHVLGYGHSNDPGDIMYPVINGRQTCAPL